MILKYKVPKEYRKRIYNNKRIIYCKIIQIQEFENTNAELYRVRMINFKNFTNIFCNKDLQELNLWDKIKIKLGGYKNGN